MPGCGGDDRLRGRVPGRQRVTRSLVGSGIVAQNLSIPLLVAAPVVRRRTSGNRCPGTA
jgi:hypothetical protein